MTNRSFVVLLQEPHANERLDVRFIQQDANGPQPLSSLLAVVAHTLRRGRGRARRGRYAVGAHDPARCGSPSAGRPPTYYTHGAITPTGASPRAARTRPTHGPHQGRTGPRLLKVWMLAHRLVR